MAVLWSKTFQYQAKILYLHAHNVIDPMQKIKVYLRFAMRHWFTSLCLAFLLYMCFGGEFSVVNILKLKRQEADLRREISQYEDSINNFQRRIDQVNVDSEHLEKHARERLHMHRRNEDLYLFDD